MLENFEVYKVKNSVLNKLVKTKIMEERESILLKGFLHKCDYCASAECEVEFNNDFLDNSLEDLKIVGVSIIQMQTGKKCKIIAMKILMKTL